MIQPLNFMKVTKPRNSSTSAASSTVRARTAEIATHRTFTSGGESATAVQLQDEVKACSVVDWEAILAELTKAGGRVEVSTAQSLGMKADLNIPWSKLRVIRRYTDINGC